MTREELIQEVGRRTGSEAFAARIAESSWGTILKPAPFAGNLCVAPSLGQRVRFTRPDSWLGKVAARVDPERATLEIARRFLRAYGPATYRDLARWWGGGGISTVRRWIAALGDEVCLVEVNGTKAWVLAEDSRGIRTTQDVRSARLLPGFDHYVVAASCHAEHLLNGAARARVYRPQGWISPVLLVNGLIAGVWRHELKGSQVAINIEPFGSAPTWVRRGVSKEAERLAWFLGCRLTSIVWKD